MYKGISNSKNYKQKYKLIKNESESKLTNYSHPCDSQFKTGHILVFCALILTVSLIYTQSSLNLANVSLFGNENATELNDIMAKITQRLSTLRLNYTNTTKSHSVVMQAPQNKYFINTSQCRIPYVDPFEKGVKNIFNPKIFKYTNCTNDEAFITPNYQLNMRQYLLHMNIPAIERAAKKLNASSSDIRCCYRQIVRSNNDDNSYKLLSCSKFHQDFIVPQHIDFIITECYIGKDLGKPIQKDAFSFIQQRNVTLANISNVPEKFFQLGSKKPNVLLLGIDSLSQINFRRTMPETFKYLQSNSWFELQGFNKIGDNTFPNLMALLTSYNESTASDKCNPKLKGGLNKPVCNLIWNNFKQYGYKTAYAEDECWMSTFNYLKKGFLQQPTDYYLRPMLMAITKHMIVKKRSGLSYCIGRKHSGEYVFDYALQFAKALPADPLFGLFWTNSFSHNSFDTTATMDVKILEYLKEMKSDGILERSIVLLFGDHGRRWGPLLKLKSGFLEERLPMMFISLPTWYRNEHPEFAEALRINQNRLTSPYDIYATMKHLLEETEPEKEFPYLNGTVRGLSIFREIPENRTCTEAGITEHWCACIAYETVPSDAEAKTVAKLVIQDINQYLEDKNISSKCSPLTFKSLKEVKKRLFNLPNQSTFRLSFIANPKEPQFQATAVYNKVSKTITTNVEEMSRQNKYEGMSDCIDLKEAKKFCICKDKS